MGVPGRSNALNIASRLGLDPAIVEATRQKLGTGRKDADGAIMELELLHQQAVADEEECAEINERMARVAQDYRKAR